MSCIYYGNKENLNFNSAEHIFPNALGGKLKLPCDYVSKEANQYFSKLERELFKGQTMLNFIRPFYIKNKETAIFEVENNNAGYLKNGELFLVPRIILKNLDKKNVEMNINFPDTIKELHKELNIILSELKNNFDKIKVKHQGIDTETVEIICRKEKNKYKFEILASKRIDIKELKNLIINGKIEKIKKSYNDIQNPEMNIQLTVNIQLYYKIFGKTAINLIAYTEGKEFVEHKDFKNIKNKILGNDNINLYKDIAFIPPHEKNSFNNLINSISIEIPFFNPELIEKIQKKYTNKGTRSNIYICNHGSNIVANFSIFEKIFLYILLVENSKIEITPIFYSINHETKEELFSKNFENEVMKFVKQVIDNEHTKHKFF